MSKVERNTIKKSGDPKGNGIHDFSFFYFDFVNDSSFLFLGKVERIRNSLTVEAVDSVIRKEYEKAINLLTNVMVSII